MSTVTFRPRGRASQKVRTGFTIKSVLQGKIPLDDGRIVTEASVNDLHNAYKALVKIENATRKLQLQPCTYHSFAIMMVFARKLGLVVKVREEDMEFPPPNGELYTISDKPAHNRMISKRHIYSLTTAGQQDEWAWSNLRKAYGDQQPVPQMMPVGKQGPVVVKPIGPYVFNEIPSHAQVKALREYLEGLIKSDTPYSGILDVLSEQVGEWSIDFEDRVAATKTKKKYQELMELADKLSEVMAAFDINESIRILKIMETKLL